MADIQTLINYLNPKKYQSNKLGIEGYQFIKIDAVFLNENQDYDSENVFKIFFNQLPNTSDFTDDYVKLETGYDLYVHNINNDINYYFQRNEDNIVTYVSIADFLLTNTTEEHFQTLDDQDFILIKSGKHYYRYSDEAIYTLREILSEIPLIAKKTLSYDPNDLDGLENGTYNVNYRDATGYTYSFMDRWFTFLSEQAKREIKVTLNPQKGKVFWYPDIEINKNNVTLYYDYSVFYNEDFDATKEGFAIKLEFNDLEGFFGFMMVTYFVKGISLLQVSEDVNNRKRNCLINYVRLINYVLKEQNPSIDQALTYLYYIPAEFYKENRHIFKNIDSLDNILGEEFIWKVIKIALEDQLTNVGINKEDVVLRLLKILKYIHKDEEGLKKEKNDYLLKQLLDRKTKDGLSYLLALYQKLNTDNFVKYNTYIYKLWANSSFVNPKNPVYKATSPFVKSDKVTDKVDKNIPRLVFPYKTNKLIGIYSSNINTEFNDKGNIVVTPDESWADNIIKATVNYGLGEILEEFVEEDWQAEYHPLQPVYLADPYNDKAIQLQTLSPMLLIKANEDKTFWSNVATTTEYAIDVITTLSGIGNIAKFRHLARAVRIAQASNKSKRVIWYLKFSKVVKGAAAGVEITAGTVNALLKLTGLKDDPFGRAVSEFLFWLELLTLTGELTAAISKGLKTTANTLTKGKELDLLNESLDDLVKKGEIDLFQKIKIIDELENVKRVKSGRVKQFKEFVKRWENKSIKELTTKEIADNLRGFTEQANRVANIIEDGRMKVYILEEDAFKKAYLKEGGDLSRYVGTEAFSSGKNNYFRETKSVVEFMSELVHEGTHALDNFAKDELFDAATKTITNFDEWVKEVERIEELFGNRWSFEKRAFFHERAFQEATEMVTEYKNIRKMINNIEYSYPKEL